MILETLYPVNSLMPCWRVSPEAVYSKSTTALPKTSVSTEFEEELLYKEEGVFLCKNCNNRITTVESIIAVNGHHRHVFTNPEGLTFEIGCFRTAEGCIVHGIPTMEHTWFKGFQWNYAHCSECLLQLGWFYQRAEEGFFGLILERLIDTTRMH